MEENFDGNAWNRKKKKMCSQKRSMAVNLYFNEGMSIRGVADALNVSHMTVWRVLSKVTAEEAVGVQEIYPHAPLFISSARQGR